MIRRKVIPRERWNSAPAKAWRSMTSAEDGVFIHHSVSAAPTTKAGERAEMRNLQQIAFSRGFSDVSYSYVVFPSGRIYEGRGRGIEGAHTSGYNATAYGLCAAGNYDASKPTSALVKSLRWLRRKHLNLAHRPVRAHRQVYSTACPGRHLNARIGEL